MAGAMYGKVEPDGDEGGDDLMVHDMGNEEESDDPVVKLARKAFPDMDWTPERASALEELISHCSGMGDDYGPKSDRMGMGDMGDDKGKKAALILALGPPKRK